MVGRKPHEASSASSRSSSARRQSESATAARIEREASWSCADAKSRRARARCRGRPQPPVRQTGLCVGVCGVLETRASREFPVLRFGLFEECGEEPLRRPSRIVSRLEHAWTPRACRARAARPWRRWRARSRARRRGRTCEFVIFPVTIDSGTRSLPVRFGR